MSTIFSISVAISLIMIIFKFFIAANIYEKILTFYLIFSNFILLIAFNAVASFEAVLDVIIILFLLQLLVILFLLFGIKKS